LYGNEWAYIPHFYRNFYVYQYATSLTASTALANRIRSEMPATAARDAYLKMLSSGSRSYPVDLLKDAGVDMTTSAPFDEAIKDMNETMDQIEAILDKKA
jgi:oligoendopeptidase F